MPLDLLAVYRKDCCCGVAGVVSRIVEGGSSAINSWLPIGNQSTSWAIRLKAPAASCAEQRLRALVRISRYHSGNLLRGSSARVVNMVNAGVDMAEVVG